MKETAVGMVGMIILEYSMKKLFKANTKQEQKVNFLLLQVYVN